MTRNSKESKQDATEPQQVFLNSFNHMCLTHYSNPSLTVSELASLLNMGERQLQRKVKALTAQSPIQVLKTIRLMQAKFLLEQGEQPTKVAYSCGFSNYEYFSRSFKAKFTHSPKHYQNQYTASPD